MHSRFFISTRAPLRRGTRGALLRSVGLLFLRRLLVTGAALAFGVSPSAAQDGGVKLAIGNVGIGLGDVPRLDGLRLNYRDRNLQVVNGINATIWTHYRESTGVVRGLALGVPMTGAAAITGLAVGFGVAVDRDFDGIGITALGMGAGNRVRGIALSGIGVGGGGDLEGIMVGGIGLGVGGNIKGVAIGGVGAGGGGNIMGIGIGGVGVGVGGNLMGLALGGLGVGAGGNIDGVIIGGIGVGAGGDVTGLAIGGIGVGAGGHLKGLAIGGVGVGASRLTGVALSGLGAGAQFLTGLAIAPAYFKVSQEGYLRGVAIAAVNNIRGEQRGLVIGVINVAEELHGLQIGLINVARNKESLSVLPIFNYHR